MTQMMEKKCTSLYISQVNQCVTFNVVHFTVLSKHIYQSDIQIWEQEVKRFLGFPFALSQTLFVLLCGSMLV